MLVTLQFLLPSFEKRLEEGVITGLVPVVASVVALMLFTNALLFKDSSASNNKSAALQLMHGGIALGCGSAFFHVVIVLFGAPVNELVLHTYLLATLLASLTVLPVAMCLGLDLQEWIAVLINLRARTLEDIYLASTAIGAVLGAYVGALPIPLDWDRPWQATRSASSSVS
uniref:Uncharacterized protein n=1 Tax=Globisporangium ultimum (strain ATCC 200006 / CBS 805.95 / DAOM BR144) TaxID=431595 RepID=K3WLC7_GLOUD